jgi:hypothetical protein
VIATTFRLWWQRRLGSATPGARTLRRAGISALVCALLVASAAAIYLDQARGGGRATGRGRDAASGASGSGSDAVVAATQVRQRAAAWVASQVGHGVIVACDPLMCAALQHNGFPAASLAPIQPGAGDPLGSGIVISTASVRSQFGARLTTVYAPQVIASFGAGADRVQVLVTAPRGATAYRAAEKADLDARRTGGADLILNPNVHTTVAARRLLAAGLVDARLLITLAALADRYPLYIRSFGDGGPSASPGTPLRSVSLTTASAGYMRDIVAFLRAQRAPLLAQTTARPAGRATIVQIAFAAPSPTGLLSQS